MPMRRPVFLGHLHCRSHDSHDKRPEHRYLQVCIYDIQKKQYSMCIYRIQKFPGASHVRQNCLRSYLKLVLLWIEGLKIVSRSLIFIQWKHGKDIIQKEHWMMIRLLSHKDFSSVTFRIYARQRFCKEYVLALLFNDPKTTGLCLGFSRLKQTPGACSNSDLSLSSNRGKTLLGGHRVPATSSKGIRRNSSLEVISWRSFMSFHKRGILEIHDAFHSSLWFFGWVFFWFLDASFSGMWFE